MNKLVFLCAIFAIFLSGCGGGGSGEEPDNPPSNELIWDSEKWDQANWQ